MSEGQMDRRLISQLEGCSEDEIERIRADFLGRPQKEISQRARDDLAEEAEDRLIWLRLAEPAKHGFTGKPASWAFDIVSSEEPGESVADRLIRTGGGWSSSDVLFPDIKPTDIGGRGNMHHRTMAKTNDGNAPYELGLILQSAPNGFGYDLHRVRLPYHWIIAQARIDNRGLLHLVAGANVGWSPHTSWIHTARPMRGAKEARRLRETMVGALNAMLERRYTWRVEMGFPGHPRVVFDTDPSGARHIYADRETRGNRRASLRHWVSAHWRRKASDQADRAWVREHLRGATEFEWHGLHCALYPSRFDLESEARAKAHKLFCEQHNAQAIDLAVDVHLDRGPRV